MRVFITGATGFIGSATVTELVNAGHEVIGLTRSDAGAAALSAAGAEVHRGSLEDLDSLRRGAAASDGVIHTAFNHDFSVPREVAAQADRAAIQAMGEVLYGTDRPLIITSGTAVLGPGRLAREDSPRDTSPLAAARGASEDLALSMVEKGVRASVMRFPPSVHGRGDHGFVPYLIAIARDKGVSAYIGDGSNRWAAVHRLDGARLFRLAIESAPAGTVLHGVADEGIPTREIAEVIGRHLDVPVVSKAPDEAEEHFSWLGAFFALDVPATSALTRERMGWEPTQPGLMEDLKAGHYFQEARSRAA